MNIGKFLRDLRARDISIYLDGETLRFRAPAGALTTTLRDLVSRHRGEIICQLRDAPSPEMGRRKCTICIPDNWRDEQSRNGRIRTTCRACGRFIGYRPV